MKNIAIVSFIVISISFISNATGKKVLVLGEAEKGCSIYSSGAVVNLNDDTPNQDCQKYSGESKSLQVDKGGRKWTITNFN